MTIEEVIELVQKEYSEKYGDDHGVYGYFVAGSAIYIILYQDTDGAMVDDLEVIEIVGDQVRKVELEKR